MRLDLSVPNGLLQHGALRDGFGIEVGSTVL